MKKPTLILLATSLVIAGGLSYFASPSPDGLERVAENMGFIEQALEPVYTVLPDYTVPGLSGALSNGLAGIIGTLVTFGVTILLARILRRKKHDGLSQSLQSR